jgi:hypothetical protein
MTIQNNWTKIIEITETISWCGNNNLKRKLNSKILDIKIIITILVLMTPLNFFIF